MAAPAALAQGVPPGGPIGGSTAIGIGGGRLPGGGTGPSYPSGIISVNPSPSVPPGGTPPSQYPQPRDPFDPTTPRNRPPPKAD